MKLKPIHHQAILLFSANCKNKDIAEKLKVTPETVSVWRNDYAVQAELNKILEASNQAASDKMRSLSIIALETINGILTDKEAPTRDRLTAAIKVLELNRISQSRIGATNEAVLAKEAEEDSLLSGYGL
ncbi:MAG: hypothetical protein QM500_05235 [Methylococcales bacterium]